jgi:BlaI family transcriptional regulator, penicillinase repressor
MCWTFNISQPEEPCKMTHFTPGELEVMQVLWEHGSLKPAEIQEKFPRPVQNETLRSALRVLLEKGHITRRKVGKAFYYEALAPKQNAFQRMARRMAETFCGGSPAAMIAQLIKSERLSDQDIAELRRITAQKAQKQASRKTANKTGEKP